jgi:2-amino-4-hydroxy-6-hydroxymethyldihydropteridine diphosphokinase
VTSTLQDTLDAVPRFQAFIGMGGNLGDVQACLRAALAGMQALPGTQLEAVSTLYQTKPVDATGPDYLNAVAVVQTALAPGELLGALLALETAHERQRPYLNAPRTLDLDLLWHGGALRASAVLTLPHPRMPHRAFVLEPLAEVLAGLGKPATCPQAGPNLPDAATRERLAREQGIACLGAWIEQPLNF